MIENPSIYQRAKYEKERDYRADPRLQSAMINGMFGEVLGRSIWVVVSYKQCERYLLVCSRKVDKEMTFQYPENGSKLLNITGDDVKKALAAAVK